MAVTMLLSVPSYISLMNEMTASLGGTGGGASMGAASIGMIVGGVIAFVFYLVIIGVPGVLLILVYRSRNVEMTTRYYDQTPSWTEKCHVFVLALWLLYVLGALTTATTFFGYGDLMVSLGILSSVTVGRIVIVALVVIFSLLAFGVSRNAPWAWWGSLGYLIACLGLSFYFFNTVDMESLVKMTMVDTGEMDEAMLSYARSNFQTGFYTGLLSLAALIGFLFMIRKHFFPAEEAAREA